MIRDIFDSDLVVLTILLFGHGHFLDLKNLLRVFLYGFCKTFFCSWISDHYLPLRIVFFVCFLLTLACSHKHYNIRTSSSRYQYMEYGNHFCMSARASLSILWSCVLCAKEAHITSSDICQWAQEHPILQHGLSVISPCYAPSRVRDFNHF